MTAMKNNLKVIGLSGTNGSGKDTIGELLAEHQNYWFFSLTELLRDECKKRNLPVMRQNLRQISAEWRRESGLATLIDRAIIKFKEAGGFDKYAGVVMSSLRNPYEADRIHDLGGTVIWVDADPHVRYERIQKNAAQRGRSGEDNISFEEFLQHEAEEMHAAPDADEAALSIAAVKERAGILIDNNSNLQALKTKLATYFS